MNWQLTSARLALIGLILLWLNTGVWLIFGVLATILGGEWTHFGEGLGGGWAIPGLVFDLVLLLSLPSLVIGIHGLIKRDAARAWRLLAFAGPFTIAFAFIGIAHTIDPCASHHWTLLDFWGDQRLCERFGHELNIHTRFHLLLHIAPVVGLVAIYHILVRRFVLHRHLDSASESAHDKIT